MARSTKQGPKRIFVAYRMKGQTSGTFVVAGFADTLESVNKGPFEAIDTAEEKRDVFVSNNPGAKECRGAKTAEEAIASATEEGF